MLCSTFIQGGLIAAFDPIRSERIYSLTCTYQLLLLYEELSENCRNESASSLSFPRGVLGSSLGLCLATRPSPYERPVVLRPHLTAGLPFSQSTQGGAPT
jgi:hypothetical protein